MSNLSRALFQLPNPSLINDEFLSTEVDSSPCCFAKQQILQYILYLLVQTAIQGYLLYHDVCRDLLYCFFCPSCLSLLRCDWMHFDFDTSNGRFGRVKSLQPTQSRPFDVLQPVALSKVVSLAMLILPSGLSTRDYCGYVKNPSQTPFLRLIFRLIVV